MLARSGVTTIPGTTVKFAGFGDAPAIDKQGNVVFTGGGTGRAGVYTALGGTCCQRVADTTTPIPGRGGELFFDFSGSQRHDIDNGRVAFKAMDSARRTGLYSNVGQATATTLAELAVLDGVEWNVLGDPWVDGSQVGVYGNQLIPSSQYAILLWNGATGGESFVNPGTGYAVGYNNQASLSTGAAILARAKVGSYQMGIAQGSTFETLATANVTSMPDLGAVFTNFYAYPLIDRGGDDAAFLGYGSQKQGLFKRVNGGALQNVVDNTTPVPDSGSDVFKIIYESGIALANGQVVFAGQGQYTLRGVYTDVGGALSVLFDNEIHNTIVAGGQTLTINSFNLSTRSFAHTPQGYMMVFRLDLPFGQGSAIVRATINDGPGSSDGTFTVNKDFSDNSTASVSVTASCSSGTVTNSPQTAREGVPAVFNVTGALAGATCTATEPTVPSGYTRNQTDCQNGDPLGGSCTIVNTLNTVSGTFTVHKDFSDNNTASVSVTATCSSGTVTNNPQLAREGLPAVFNISGATAGATCTATEPTVPSGYTRNQTDCQNGDPLNGSCTIVNTLNTVSGTFTVHKDFSDNNAASVSVTATCSSGTVTNNPQLAREGLPAVFNISGATAGATCTATEPTVPTGYTRNQTDCQNGDPLNGSCTILNTLNTVSGTFTVNKDFSDNNTAGVSITASCSSGTVTNSPRTATESSPAVFTVTGAIPGATCTATEPTVPTGYTRNQADCQSAKPLNGSCTVVNTKNSHTFTVHKDFEDDIAASVSVSLSCTSGTVTNSPRLASEGAPAVFTISGATTGATCTASEPTVPTGYAKNESDCQNGDPLNGSCTIVNTPEATRTGDTIASSGFETGQAEGWSMNSGAKIDGTVAMGQYSLLLPKGGTNSVRSVSTAGYSAVSVTMNVAANSLEKGEVCHAELSTNGGSTWTSVLQVGDGLDTSTFQSASVSPTAASNNANLRLRFRMVGKGKGDYCWGDEVIVQGTAMSGTASSDKAPSDSLQLVASGFEESAVDSGAMGVWGGYGSRGFDPGFDHLFGDGVVARDVLAFDDLMNGRTPVNPVAWTAFTVPAGAAQPAHLFEGGLALLGLRASSGNAMPAFNFEFVQLGNHLYPLGRGVAAEAETEWGYLLDTGRVWRESGDSGFSRAAIPFTLVQRDTGCMQDGVVTFLFRDDGATSNAVYQLASRCATSPFDSRGSLEAVYTPTSLGNQSIDIESVMGCAADSWLPLVQGRGGITMVLTGDGTSHFVLSDASQQLWLDAVGESAAISELCR